MALNITNKDLRNLQFVEGKNVQAPVSERPLRPLVATIQAPVASANSPSSTVLRGSSSSDSDSDSDSFLFFRGTWQSFTVYNVNDVVIDNGSSYIAIQSSVNQEPDQGNTAQWTLLGKNLNFRGVWSSLNPIRQTNQQGGSNGNATNVVFNQNVLARSRIIVVISVQNIGGSAAPNTPTDTQGNTYSLLYNSPREDGNEYSSWMYLSSEASAGALTVNISYANGGPPGNQQAIVAEAIGISGFDHAGTAGATGSSGAWPSITVSSTSASEFIVTGMVADGTFSGFPSGYTGIGLFSATGMAWFYPSVSGNNTVSWNGSFNNSGIRFTGGAATFTLVAGLKYNPYDVVEFNGSMYLCVVSTNGSPISAPSSWTLFAQATGLAQVKTANYTAVSTDEGSLLTFNGSNLTLTLPATLPDSGWYIFVQNLNVTNLTINPNGLQIDSQGGSLSIGQFSGLIIFTDGTNYFTTHDLTAISVSSIFTISTNVSGAVTIGLANENANTFLGGPVSGPAATPTFRGIQDADLPATVPIVPSELTVSGNVASPAGSLVIGKSVQPAGTVWASPANVAGVPTFQSLSSLIGTLAIAKAVGTYQTTSKSGFLRLGPAAFATPRFVQGAATVYGNAQPATLAFPSPNTQGNMILVYASNVGATPSAVTISDTQGNTYRQLFAQSVFGSTQAVWYALNVNGGANTVTVSPGTNNDAMTVLEYSGVQSVNALDIFNSLQGSGTLWSSQAGTVTQNNELIIAIGQTLNGNTTLAAPFILREVLNNVTPTTYGVVGETTTVSGGTFTASGTNTSGTWLGMLIALRASPQPFIPPAGMYRVSIYTLLEANPAAGSLTTSIGWNDGIAARTFSPSPALDTSALNFQQASCVLVTDGIHDITWSTTLV